MARVEAGLRRLQRQQRLQQHAGAGQQHEARGDLRHGEHPLPAAGAAGDPHAAAREIESMRPIGRRQARDKRQEHRRDDCQRRSHPQHAGIDCQIERADRKAGRVARQDGHHRPRAQHAQRRARAAQQEAFGQQVRRSAAVLAPSAARIASSPSRRTVRARIRFATFEHAMTKTSTDAASSTHSTVRARDVI